MPFGLGAWAVGAFHAQGQTPPQRPPKTTAVASAGTDVGADEGKNTTTVDYYGDLMTQRKGDTVL